MVHALHHPDRMRAANELKPGERPEVTTSMPQDAYDAAKEQLHQVDARILNDLEKRKAHSKRESMEIIDLHLKRLFVG